MSPGERGGAGPPPGLCVLLAFSSVAGGACARSYPSPGFYRSSDLAQANVLSHFVAEQHRGCSDAMTLSYAGHSDEAIATDPVIREEKWRVRGCGATTELVLDCQSFPGDGARCKDHTWKSPTPSPPTLDSELLRVAIESADRLRCSDPSDVLGEGGPRSRLGFTIQLDSSPRPSPGEATFSLFRCSQEVRIRVRCEEASGCREIDRQSRPIDRPE